MSSVRKGDTVPLMVRIFGLRQKLRRHRGGFSRLLIDFALPVDVFSASYYLALHVLFAVPTV